MSMVSCCVTFGGATPSWTCQKTRPSNRPSVIGCRQRRTSGPNGFQTMSTAKSPSTSVECFRWPDPTGGSRPSLKVSWSDYQGHLPPLLLLSLERIYLVWWKCLPTFFPSCLHACLPAQLFFHPSIPQLIPSIYPSISQLTAVCFLYSWCAAALIVN